MPSITINTDGRSILSNNVGTMSVSISKAENNCVCGFNESGGIMTKKGEPETGGDLNTPGNSIGYVSSSESLNVIQCNSTVSRVKKGDPDSSNEGVYMPNLINKIKETLSSGGG